MSARQVYAGGASARYVLMAVVFALTMLGLVMIYSASSITAAAREGSSAFFFTRQLGFVAIGAIIAGGLARLDYRALRDRALLLWAGSVGMLLLTLVMGAVRGGARRWLSLGPINVQPSEIAKIACVLLIAAFAVEWQRGKSTTREFLIRVSWATVVPAGLIIMQPDLGTTMTLVVAVALVLFLAGVGMRWVAIAGGLGIGFAVMAIALAPYRMKRFTAFLDPWADPLGKGYQSIQALLAFGTGGVDGVGLGLSRQKFFYLPEAHTDFILAIIGEEIGLIGTLAVVAAFAVLMWAGFKIAMGAKDPFGRLLAGGITGMLGFQAFLNMAAVTGVMPVTGKPLPFVSYGGSSILVTMVCIGLVLSVSQHGGTGPRAVRVGPRKEDKKRESLDERRGNGRTRVPRADGGRAVRRRA